MVLFSGIGTGLVGKDGVLVTLDRTIDWGASDTSVFVVDWNGDGLLDLLVGTRTGKVFLLRNSGTRVRPQFGARSAVALQAGGRDLKVDGFAAPCAGDWDGDGDLDLVVGDLGGDVWLFRRSEGKLGLAELLVAHGDDPTEGPQEYAHPALADWNGDGRLDLLVGDHWVERGKRPELSAAQAQELDACTEELRLLSGRIGGARERVGDAVCQRMGLDWRELWKLDGATRTRYQEEFERGLREDQLHVNAGLAIDFVEQRAREFEATDREHGRVWVYLRE